MNNPKIERLYHVVAINEKTGHKTYVTLYPMPHKQACNNKARFTVHKARRIQLEECATSES